MCVTVHLSDRSVHRFDTPDDAARFIAQRRDMVAGHPQGDSGEHYSPLTPDALRLLHARRHGDPVTPDDLMAPLGLARQTVNRILRHLCTAGHAERVGSGRKLVGLYRITAAGSREVRDESA